MILNSSDHNIQCISCKIEKVQLFTFLGIVLLYVLFIINYMKLLMSVPVNIQLMHIYKLAY